VDRELLPIIRLWNDFVRGMLQARDSWNELNEIALNQRPQLEDTPFPFQRAFSSFGKARFSVALPRFIDWSRMYNGLDFEKLLVSLEEVDEGLLEPEEEIIEEEEAVNE
jgi:hypothetical protein